MKYKYGNKPTQYKKKWYPKKQEVNAGPRVREVRNWSSYQQNIFKDVESGAGHTMVSAVPGSGKTTTIVESLYHVPFGADTIFLAFNKSIQMELSNKVPESSECKTLHSLGFSVLRNSLGKVDVDNDKVYRAIVGLYGEENETSDMRENIRKCVSLAKGYLAETNTELDEIIDRHGVEAGVDNERVKFIEGVQKVLELSKIQNKMIDFDDMLWLVHKLNLSAPKYDRIFVDETQDLNTSQVELLMKMCGNDTRMTFVGDKFQAIYGFRGAMSDAIDRIVDRTGAKYLPLTVSYRCAKRIVELAKEVQPEIEAATDAPDGIVEYLGKEKMIKDAMPGDFIISRTNAPLVGLCLSFLKAGRRANIQGRDMGKSLAYMIKKSGAVSVNEFLDWLEHWKDLEVERLTARNKDYTYVTDRYECMLAFSEGATSLGQIKSNIENVFDDGDDSTRIMLGTTHKLKGLERNKAWVLTPTYKPGRNQEESNLWYVAVTRAKNHLCLVESI